MNYRVEWTPRALQGLANAWVTGADRSAVASASDTIDALLQRDPLSQGESRPGNRRILIVLPLAVIYDVDPNARTVTVWSAWLC
jgi:plasmid stabilization system protein ParE